MIVYSVDNGQATDVYLYDVTTGKETPLVVDDPGVYKFSFAWSPDGRQIAYQADFHPPDSRLMVVDVGSGQTRTLAYSAADRNWFPSWSPDGKRIAFSSDRDHLGDDFHIYTMNVDGTGVVRLTDFNSATPNWSPDGKRIAFESDWNGNYEIYVMNTDGTNVRRLTDNPANDYQPVWSPDGKQILFTSQRDGNQEVYAMNADGSDPVNLTNDPSNDIAGSWSPDGKFIVFNSNRGGSYQIYSVSAAGGEPNLLPTSENASSPVWSP
jgi:TolB protein